PAWKSAAQGHGHRYADVCHRAACRTAAQIASMERTDFEAKLGRGQTLSTVQTAGQVDSPSKHPGGQHEMKVLLFLASLVISAAAFVTFDYFYTATILGSAVSGGPHGFCFARDPVRSFAFQPNCFCIRPWLETRTSSTPIVWVFATSASEMYLPPAPGPGSSSWATLPPRESPPGRTALSDEWRQGF